MPPGSASSRAGSCASGDNWDAVVLRAAGHCRLLVAGLAGCRIPRLGGRDRGCGMAGGMAGGMEGVVGGRASLMGRIMESDRTLSSDPLRSPLLSKKLVGVRSLCGSLCMCGSLPNAVAALDVLGASTRSPPKPQSRQSMSSQPRMSRGVGCCDVCRSFQSVLSQGVRASDEQPLDTMNSYHTGCHFNPASRHKTSHTPRRSLRAHQNGPALVGENLGRFRVCLVRAWVRT